MTNQPIKTKKGILYSGGLDQLDNDTDALTPNGGTGEGDANLSPTPNAGRDNVDNLSPEEATFKQRYGSLRAEFTRKTASAEQEIATLKKQVEQLQAHVSPEMLPTSPDQLVAWMREHPELAGAIKALTRSEIEQEVGSVKEALTRLSVKEKQIAQQEAEAKLRSVHPDIDELRRNVKFHEWARTKSARIQEALYGEDFDADATAEAITLYKAEAGLFKPAKPRQPVSALDASLDVSTSTITPEPLGTPGRIWKESEVERMSDRDYEKYEDEIVKAIDEGRFERDLSG